MRKISHDPADLLSPDMLDAGDGPAAQLSEVESRALVARVLERAQVPPARTNVVRMWRAPTVVLAVVVASSAAAAAYRGGWPTWLGAPATRASSAVQAAGPATKSPPPEPVETDPRAAVENEVLDASTPVVDDAAGGGRAVSASRPRSRALRSPPRPRATPDTRSAAPVAQAPVPPAFDAQAADTLERANAARGAQRYSEALALYSRVVGEYPASLQAQAARVAAAALSLEHLGDASRAERLYTDAAERGGELAAEARFGIAESHRARHDTESEARALRELLAAHPRSPLARAARRRLEALER